MKKPKASVIILNWNGKRFIDECVKSLLAQSYKDFEIIYVDNGSKDDSVDYIKKKYGGKVRVIVNEKNLGYAGGNNVGIRNAKGEFVIILNNDASVDKDWLKELVRVAEDEKIGMVSCRTLFYDTKKVDTLGLKVLKCGLTKDIKSEEEIKKLFCPSGCAVLYKKKMLEDVKIKGEYLDEGFFAYYEDFDLGFRARLRGWKAAYAGKAIVYHHHAASAGVYNRFSIYHGNRNSLWVMYKCFPKYIAQANMHWIILAQIVAVLKYFLMLRIFTIIKAKVDAISGFKRMKEKRRIIMKGKTVSDKEIERMVSGDVF